MGTARRTSSAPGLAVQTDIVAAWPRVNQLDGSTIAGANYRK